MWQRSLLSEYIIFNSVALMNLIIKSTKNKAAPVQKHLTYQCVQDTQIMSTHSITQWMEISHQPSFTVWPTYHNICCLFNDAVIQTAEIGSWVYLRRWYSKSGKEKNLYPYWELNVSSSLQPVSLLTYYLPWLIWITVEQCDKYRYTITCKIMVLHITYSWAMFE
jgi:hypothetical protein